ncbi:CMD domain protein [Enterovirga rhinocerotis]|uniref:CMD domain protein n=1 Tax=Enterovirga rhinocerotis TaxID=1339210 RepID=A0A4R7C4P5_9HYPH|nr:CMD domain protein [Enterovirga rhinocerotis]TDR93484.1 CMD domain protein [Enterovirga rhinocerotis]
MPQSPPKDVIDHLVGIEPGSRLDTIRAARQQARDNAQASYDALFSPDDESGMSLVERRAVAAFVAGLHRQPEAAVVYYADEFAASAPAGLAAAVAAEVARGAAEGPTGRFPQAPLAGESTAAPSFAIAGEGRAALGERLAAALEHAHFLVFHPREAEPARLQRLVAAGWSTPGIVTLSQLVSFLCFQLRVVVGLRALAASPAS